MAEDTRTPGRKLLMAILIGALLAIPLFSIYLLNYDRQSQSEIARASIAEGKESFHVQLRLRHDRASVAVVSESAVWVRAPEHVRAGLEGHGSGPVERRSHGRRSVVHAHERESGIAH